MSDEVVLYCEHCGESVQFDGSYYSHTKSTSQICIDANGRALSPAKKASPATTLRRRMLAVKDPDAVPFSLEEATIMEAAVAGCREIVNNSIMMQKLDDNIAKSSSELERLTADRAILATANAKLSADLTVVQAKLRDLLSPPAKPRLPITEAKEVALGRED